MKKRSYSAKPDFPVLLFGLAFLGFISLTAYTANENIRDTDGLPYALAMRADLIRNIMFLEQVTDVREWFEQDVLLEANNPKYIVIHHDAIPQAKFAHSPVLEIANYHTKELGKPFAYHYYITAKGSIYRMHRHTTGLPHAKGYNHNSIAVCLQGNFDTETPTYAQEQAYKSLRAYLKMLYPHAKALGHYQTGADKSCPGFFFDFNNL